MSLKNPDITKDLLKRLYIDKGLSTPQISEIVGIDKFKVYNLLKLLKIPTRTISESRMKYHKVPFSGNRTELAYLLGLRTGDVHARRHRRQISVMTTTTHPAMVKMFHDVFNGYGNVSMTSVRIINNRFGWHIRCYLDSSFYFLIEKPETVPREIMGNYKYFMAFLSGYFDSEGTIVFSGYRNYTKFRLELLSTDFNILKDIHFKLSEFGYHVKLMDIKRDIYKNGARLMILYRKNEVVKILKEMNLRHPEKIIKKELVSRFRNCNRYSEIKNVIISLRKGIKSDVVNFVKVAEIDYNRRRIMR